MEGQILSREFLRGIPAKIQREKVDRIIKSFYHDLYTVASAGATSYFYNRSLIPDTLPIKTVCSKKSMMTFAQSEIYESIMSPDELVPLFKEKFPDCKITYEEQWVNTTDNTRLLKKGIRIDWS